MLPLGHHYIAELWGCSEEHLDDKDRLQALALEAAEAAHVTVISSQFHQFSPQGVTGVLLLAESHLSLHTWPEHGYCAVDLFTCGDAQAAREAVLELGSRIQAGRIELTILGRGHLEPMALAEAEHVVLYPPFQWKSATGVHSSEDPVAHGLRVHGSDE